MADTGLNDTKDVLNTVWDKMAYAYFDRYPQDAIADFLKIYQSVKTEREKNK